MPEQKFIQVQALKVLNLSLIQSFDGSAIVIADYYTGSDNGRYLYDTRDPEQMKILTDNIKEALGCAEAYDDPS